MFVVPPPPHVCGAAHVPHESVPPQPLAGVPHVSPSFAHVVGVHPHTFAAPPPPHVCGVVHVPHVMTLEQPSLICPQLSGDGQVFSGVHGVLPHLPAVQ
jgi:hypothetical protein